MYLLLTDYILVFLNKKEEMSNFSHSGEINLLWGPYSRAIRLRQATSRTKTRQEPVFQVNNSLTNQIIPTNYVIIHDTNAQILDNRDGGS